MTSTKRFFLSLLSFILFFVSVCPSFAYADDIPTYNIPFSRPQIVDGSGYVEVLFERPSDGYRYIRLFQWQTTVASDWTELDIPVPLFLTINKNGLIKFNFEANPESIYYSVVSIYDSRLQSDGHFTIWHNLSNEGIVIRSLDYDDNIVSFNIYGSFANLTSDLINSYMPKFIVSYGSDTSLTDLFNKLGEMYEQLLQLHSDNLLVLDDLEYISSLINDLSDNLFSELSLMHDTIGSIARDTAFIIAQLNDFSDRMHGDITAIYSVLEQMLYLCTDYFSFFDEDLRAILKENIAINEKLDRIIELLEMQGESVQTTVDSSNVDEAIDIENSLLDNSNVDVSDVVNVEVNQNALTVIWDLVEKFLNSNGKVFGMVLTVLSLGLVAMILGRKV